MKSLYKIAGSFFTMLIPRTIDGLAHREMAHDRHGEIDTTGVLNRFK